MLVKCVNHFGVKKSQAIYIGDTLSDYTAAINAGIDYVWVGNDKEEPNIASVRDLLRFYTGINLHGSGGYNLPLPCRFIS